jgi:branched-chain amino acid transport system ATP-binding protein
MLDLDGVTAAYDTTPILREIDLSVEEGEIVGVMGKNGVGKTTLLKTVMGLLEPSEGTISYDGDDVTHASADERARAGIGYIPQGRDVFLKLTVEQNIKMGETIRSDSDETLYDQIYDYFPVLEERASQEAGTLSGGQQQMLAIARGLVGDNDLLLVDEPSEGLAPQIVADVAEALSKASEEVTMLLVEQNLPLALDLADRFYILDKGRVVDDGETAAVTADDERFRRYLSA